MKTLKKITIAVAFIISLSGLTSCGTTSMISAGVHYTNPSWGPPYYSGVRYYYLPDIEVYYDLSNQDFIYLDHGQWLFSGTLPSIYMGYDLYNGFVIALNFNVYQPWMHHQYYVSHYPRFYYNNVYRTAERPNIRGYNENERKPFYWNQGDRNRINELRKSEKMDRRQEILRQPQKTGYYGKNIGRPVKVKPNMRENRKGNKKNGGS
ncbi:MAG: hypothetical protein ACM3H8_07075 [Sphingobacteriales bacterium]